MGPPQPKEKPLDWFDGMTMEEALQLVLDKKAKDGKWTRPNAVRFVQSALQIRDAAVFARFEQKIVELLRMLLEGPGLTGLEYVKIRDALEVARSRGLPVERLWGFWKKRRGPFRLG